MKIGIIGAGAIGLLYGGWLGKLHEVTLFPRTKAQAGQLNEKGITVKDSASSFRTIVKADGTFSSLSSQDLVIVAVKQYDLPAVTTVLKNEDGGVPALFLQNGMGHLALLEKLPQKTILVGTVEHGASRLDGTTVKHNGHGKTNIAVYRGKWDESVQLHTDAFPFTMQPDYELMLLRKCFANAVINPLTAILKAKNGELVSNPHYARVFRAVFEELAALFPKLSREKMWEEATGICKNTCENESSMLKDVKKGARTEIDAILGYMLETAARQNSRVPLASALYEMVKGMEEKG